MRFRFKKMINSWFFEATIAVIIVFGIIFFFNIADVNKWFSRIFTEASDFIIKSIAAINSFVKSREGIEILSVILGSFLFLLLLIWRILWRLRSSKRLTSTVCPNCSQPLVRIKSYGWQRKFRGLLHIRRFYCKHCGWKGIRLKSNDNTPLTHTASKLTHVPIDKIA